MSSEEVHGNQTPRRKKLSWNPNATVCVASPIKNRSTPKRSSGDFKAVAHESPKNGRHYNVSPSGTPTRSWESTSLLNSPNSSSPNLTWSGKSAKSQVSFFNKGEAETSCDTSSNINSTDTSWESNIISHAEENRTVTVNLEFPYGGWDDGSSDGNSTCSLAIVESDVELKSSPLKRGRKRKQSEVSEEDNVILSGMGEEIERQLEAKAERNRLTVPNVKNILKTVITHPHVLAMVRRSMKDGGVAVTGDLDEFSYEPIFTRAKAKQLLDRVPDMTWAKVPELSWPLTPCKKMPPPSECQALISQELDEESDDDEEYRPGEDEPSDNDLSERGSERDVSLEQSPAYVDTDTESYPPTPSSSTRSGNTDCATQTNWSEDGVFKVPLTPAEPCSENQEENIALRTRSKLPLNDTPLEEIEQAFIPPDITPDLYHKICDNEDWQEFLKGIMAPMQAELNNDDEEEDPEYNVLAEEEIIDKEELRMDRAVKVSKRELNELMRELLEYTEMFSSDDDEKESDKNILNSLCASSFGQVDNQPSCSDDKALMDALGFPCWGSLTPIMTPKAVQQGTPSTPGLTTPVPPISPPSAMNIGDENKSPANYSGSECKGLAYYQCAEGTVSEPGTWGKDQKQQGSCGKHIQPCLEGKGKSKAGCGKEVQNLAAPTAEKGKSPSSIGEGSGLSGKSSGLGSPRKGQKCGGPQKKGKQISLNSPGKQFSLNSPGKQFSLNSPKKELSLISPGKQLSLNSPGKELSLNSPGKQFSLSSPGKQLSLNSPDSELRGKMGCAASEENGYFAHQRQVYQSPEKSYSDCIGELDQRRNDSNCESAVVTEATFDSYQELNVDGLNTVVENGGEPSSKPQKAVQLFQFVPDSEVTESSTGEVSVDGTVLLNVPQRLVLDQQMRFHVQLLTQHFLQTYQHPEFHHLASECKEHLVTLKHLGMNKNNSAFAAANLPAALDIVNLWENKLNSSYGFEIIKFMKKEVDLAKARKKSRMKYVPSFPKQLMCLMADSTAFVSPALLPPMPFSVGLVRSINPPAENRLLALGLEQFMDFIQQNQPDMKIGVLRRATEFITYYLMMNKDEKLLYTHIRKQMSTDGSPIQYYFKHKHAPPTTHYVLPFDANKLKTLRMLPPNEMPPLWKEFLHPQWIDEELSADEFGEAVNNVLRDNTNSLI